MANCGKANNITKEDCHTFKSSRENVLKVFYTYVKRNKKSSYFRKQSVEHSEDFTFMLKQKEKQKIVTLL